MRKLKESTKQWYINKLRKKKIKELANKLGFKSNMFADEFKHSHRESLRYYLWICELQKWLIEKHKIRIFVTNKVAGDFGFDRDWETY